MIDPTSGSSQPVDPAARVERARAVSRESAGATPPAAGTPPEDRITLSAEAAELQGERDELARARLIAQLRQQVSDGTYRPDPHATARRMTERGEV